VCGMTCDIYLLALSWSGFPFFTIMGVCASSAVAVDVLISLTMIPAFLGLAKSRITPKPTKRYRKAFAAASARVSTREEAAVQARAEAGEPYPKTIMDTFFSGWLKVVTKIPLLTIVVIVGVLALFAIPATQLQ